MTDNRVLWPDDRWHGISFSSQGQLRLTGLSLRVDKDGGTQMDLGPIEVRYDMWPTWFTIAKQQRDIARAARDSNPGQAIDNKVCNDTLNTEYRAALTSIGRRGFHARSVRELGAPPHAGVEGRRPWCGCPHTSNAVPCLQINQRPEQAVSVDAPAGIPIPRPSRTSTRWLRATGRPPAFSGGLGTEFRHLSGRERADELSLLDRRTQSLLWKSSSRLRRVREVV